MLRRSIVDNIVGKFRGPNDTVFVQYHESLNKIFHFSDVSWPTIMLHYGHGLFFHLNGRFPFPARVQSQEVTNEKYYVRIALTQRWKLQGENIQSIEKILPKLSLPHRNP